MITSARFGAYGMTTLWLIQFGVWLDRIGRVWPRSHSKRIGGGFAGG